MATQTAGGKASTATFTARQQQVLDAAAELARNGTSNPQPAAIARHIGDRTPGAANRVNQVIGMLRKGGHWPYATKLASVFVGGKAGAGGASSKSASSGAKSNGPHPQGGNEDIRESRSFKACYTELMGLTEERRRRVMLNLRSIIEGT